MQIPKPDLRRLDWPSVILLVMMSQTASARLVITQWTDYLFFAETLAVFGVCLGLALGYSTFKRKTVILLAAGYSIMLIPWQLTLAINTDVQLSERLASVGGRLLFSLTQFFQRDPVDDGLLFVAFISTLAWFLWLVAGYWWTRHGNYLVAVLPGGIFTLIIHLYDAYVGHRIWFVGFYILLALLLLGRLYYLQNQKSWRARRVFQMQESTFDLTRGMIIAAALFVFVAWTVPASRAGLESASRSWYRITKPWRDVQEWFSNAVESLNAPGGRVSDDLYSSQLNLGLGTPLSDSVVFKVQVPSTLSDHPRFYWRGYVYDLYQNNQWYSTNVTTNKFSPSEESLAIPDTGNRIIARFTYTTQIRQSLLYTASQPLWVSRPGEIRVATVDDGLDDLFAWYADPKILPGEQYQVRATIADPSKEELQAAGTDYPQWVTDKYLQLPENFSPRVRELAAQVTHSVDTPFDKASVLTSYLRREIKYANPLPESPPEGVDPIEWVLFDLKQGFCNYYASADVLMLRSLGIPARMAVGFAEGQLDVASNTYVVHGIDAHAWPEVYFPGIGWVEFEPTGNQDPLTRPSRPDTAPDSANNTLGGNQNNGGINSPSTLDDRLSAVENIQVNTTPPRPLTSYPLFYVGLSAILISMLWFLDRRYSLVNSIPVRMQTSFEKNGGKAPDWVANWVRWTELSPIERAFDTINRSLYLLGETPPIYATPGERARVLSEILPTASSAITTLTEQHQASLFTPQAGSINTARRASLSIWLYTLLDLFKHLLEKLSRRFSRPGQFR